MTKEEILNNLCYYDKRKPDCIYNDEDIEYHRLRVTKDKGMCYCGNCFSGRTKLANELLKYIK